MDYKIKDIYITILPGFYLLIWTFICWLVFCVNDNEEIDKRLESLTSISGIITLLIPLVSILIGCIINMVSGVIYKKFFCHERDVLNENPSLVKRIETVETIDNQILVDFKKSKNKKDAKQARHAAQAVLEPNQKVEEYFVRYAHARNLCFSAILCFIICVVIYCQTSFGTHICSIITILVINIMIALLLYFSYKHQAERYVETIFNEYINHINKTNNNENS